MKSASALKLLVILALILVIPASHGLKKADAAEQARITAQQFHDKTAVLLNNKNLNKASVSILVKSLKDGAVIYENNSEQALMPASNMKLVTTAAALEKLGKDFKYFTRFYLTAKPDGNGVVNGSLIVKGAGDPNISGRGQASVTALLENAAKQLKANGVKKITGDIIIDDTIFDREYVHPDWPADQGGRWYQAEVGGVSFNDNCLDFTVSAGDSAGAPANVTTAPATGYATLNNSCKTITTGKGHGASISRKGDTNTFNITGKFKTKATPYTVSIPIHNPGLYFGTVLGEVLQKSGIPVGGKVALAEKSYDAGKDGLTAAAEIVSDIKRTITVANQRSQNFYAESMCKLLGRNFGAAGSWTEGAKVTEAYLNALGIPKANYTIRDGSGLSKNNRVSARALVAVLEHMRSSPLAQIYFDSLAVSGLNETSLEKRLTEAPYADRVHAKTGSLNNVSALSGYAVNLDGDIFAFSIIVNGTSDSAAEQLQDAICRLLVTLQISK
jgi:D-alanyl-D-alanine carboxypeptidase/D-alanyl-D-alanine-endopeptidase (penicillin-binding protein 4)